MSDVNYWRQLDFISLEDLDGVSVTIIGAGGIGSFVALGLSKLGILEMEIWDGDKVEDHNVPNQFFKTHHIGRNKAKITALQATEYGGIYARARDRFWNKEPLSGFVISAVDDMAVRKKIWEACKLQPRVKLLVDGRIGGEDVKVIALKPTDIDAIKQYEATLFSNEEAAELPCTSRAIIDVAFLVTALIIRAVRGYIKDGECCTYLASMRRPEIHIIGGKDGS